MLQLATGLAVLMVLVWEVLAAIVTFLAHSLATVALILRTFVQRVLVL